MLAACFELVCLEARTMPTGIDWSSVTVVRPLEFAAATKYESVLVAPYTTWDGSVFTRDKTLGTLTLSGTMDYVTPTDGRTGGFVAATTVGRGTEYGNHPTRGALNNSYSSQGDGKLRLVAAVDGRVDRWSALVAAGDGFKGQTTFVIDGAGGQTVPVSSGDVVFRFDPTTHGLDGSFDLFGPDGIHYRMTASGPVGQPGAAPTDVSVPTATIARGPDGGLSVTAEVQVSGKLPVAAAGGRTATFLRAYWADDAGREEAVTGAEAAVPWNAGRVAVQGNLPPAPAWATRVRFVADREQSVDTTTPSNNVKTLLLPEADVLPPVVPPVIVPVTPPVIVPVTPPVIVPVTPPVIVPVTPPVRPPVRPPVVTPIPVQARPPLSAVVSATPGRPVSVTLLNADGSVKYAFTPFEAAFTGGVSVVQGDVNGDGIDDVVVGAGVGGGPRVVVYDGATGAVRSDFFAFDSAFRGGVTVAVGADGAVVAGYGPVVRAFRGPDGLSFAETAVFEETFTGGVHLAVGDVNGDGIVDLVAGAADGGGPRVRVFDGRDYRPLADYFVGDPAGRGGVRLALADLNGDRRTELVADAGLGRRVHDPLTGGLLAGAIDPAAINAVFIG